METQTHIQLLYYFGYAIRQEYSGKKYHAAKIHNGSLLYQCAEGLKFNILPEQINPSGGSSEVLKFSECCCTHIKNKYRK